MQLHSWCQFILHRSIFMEMMSVDTLITQIINQAQKMVGADRASLFLLDNKTNQLYARWRLWTYNVFQHIIIGAEYLTYRVIITGRLKLETTRLGKRIFLRS